MQRPPTITLHQQELTPQQLAYAKWFAQERIRTQLAPGPVDEAQAMAYLAQAYQTAGLAALQVVQWLDSPLAFVHVVLPKPSSVQAYVQNRMRDSVRNSVQAHVWACTQPRLEARVWASVRAYTQPRVEARVWARVGDSVWDSVWEGMQTSVRERVWDSVRAYRDAADLACYRLFDELLAPNAPHALAHFNEMVCGYVLEEKRTLLVRKPVVLERDRFGRLHNAQGKCLEYADGWGFYAWHGVRVPAKVILQPDALTKADWREEPDVQVRRVIQERMGERFVEAMGGICLDHGIYADLYQVALPGDPESVARYLKLQDSSTSRQYFLRVPRDITNADAGVAWSFGVSQDDYAPDQQA